MLSKKIVQKVTHHRRLVWIMFYMDLILDVLYGPYFKYLV